MQRHTSTLRMLPPSIVFAGAAYSRPPRTPRKYMGWRAIAAAYFNFPEPALAISPTGLALPVAWQGITLSRVSTGNGGAPGATGTTNSLSVLESQLISSDSRDLVRFLHDKIHMTDDEIAAAAHVRSQTVRRWRSAMDTSPPRNTERLDDLRSIVVLLLQSGVLRPEEIGRWLRARTSDLGYARPTVLIGKGEFDAVRRAADQHVARLEGRTLRRGGPTSTLEAEIDELLLAATAEGQGTDTSDRECVHHGSDDPSPS